MSDHDPAMTLYATLTERGWLPPKRNGTVDDCRAALAALSSTPRRSCASCERELSAVRLELQAVVRERDTAFDAAVEATAHAKRLMRERDQYRDALECVATHARLDEKERGFGESSRFRGIAEHALSRERKDTE